MAKARIEIGWRHSRGAEWGIQPDPFNRWSSRLPQMRSEVAAWWEHASRRPKGSEWKTSSVRETIETTADLRSAYSRSRPQSRFQSCLSQNEKGGPLESPYLFPTI